MNLQSKIVLYLLAFVITLYGFLCLITAWACDDAMITFRVVDHFIHGYGPVWNIAERVQVYTHPLWFLVLSGVCSISREIYYAPIFLSLLLSFVVLYFVTTAIASSRLTALFAVTLLCVSKAYIEYSTSGLENPLSHFLLVLFLVVYLKESGDVWQQMQMAFLIGLALLNRLDLLFFFVFPAVYLLHQERSWKTLTWFAVGMIPLAAWEIFSVIYYGFPFPNTAYAKVFNNSLSDMELAWMGIIYLKNSLWLDPVTLVTITISLAVTFYHWTPKRGMIALGILGYLLYVIKIGGDFMSGRFLTVPFLAAVVLLSHYSFEKDKSKYKWISIWAGIWLLAFLSPDPILRSTAKYGSGKEIMIAENGIANERTFYYQKLGLLADDRKPFSVYREYLVRDMPVVVACKIGLAGYLVKPPVYIVDLYALSDPFLARLPALKPVSGEQKKIGHLMRYVPDGYIASIQNDGNLLQDKNLALFYDKLCIITRGPIWTWERFKVIWRMNTGCYDDLIDRHYYADPRKKVIPYRDIGHSMEAYREWFDSKNTIFANRGVTVVFDPRCYATGMEISLEPLCKYTVSVVDGETTVWEKQILKDDLRTSAMRNIPLEIPSEIAEKGYTGVTVKPMESNMPHSLGHVLIQ